jgi:hypothetical protein
MTNVLKVIAVLSVLAITFCSGLHVSNLKWEAKHADYVRAEAQAALQKQQLFQREREALEATTSRLRIDLDKSLSDSDELREQVRVWSNRAKTAESRLAVQCLSLVEEERRARLEGEAIIRFCREALPQRGGANANQ